MSKSIDQIFVKRLNQCPKLRKRIKSLLNVVENVAGDCTRADDAEWYVIEKLRRMGNDALHFWGDKAAINSSEQLQLQLKEQQTKLQGHGKKSLYELSEQMKNGKATGVIPL